MTNRAGAAGRGVARTLRTLTASLVLITSACDLPRDPEGTTEQVQGRTIRVGVLHQGPLQGRDAEAVERVARELSAEVELVRDDPHTLVAMLGEGELHLLVGDLPRSSAFESELGLSSTIGRLTIGDREEERVLAVRPGENRFLLRVNRSLADLAPSARP